MELPLDYETLKIIWWGLVGILLIGFAATDRDGLARIEGDRFLLTAAGRPFARTVAAVFDAHLASGRGRHSMAV